MSQETGAGRAPTSPWEDPSSRGTVVLVTATFAGVILLVNSSMEILQGIAAIANGDLYAADTEYLYKLNMDVWGTVHIVLGVVGLVVGFAIVRRASWAPVAGMVVAGLTILGNFAFLPHNPAWSIIVIGFSVAALWAFSVLKRSGSSHHAH